MSPSKFLIPTIAGLIALLIMKKYFPEHPAKPFSSEDLRGGDSTKTKIFTRLIQMVYKRLQKSRALKVALVTVFLTYGIQCFTEEIIQLLISDDLEKLCASENNGVVKIVCDMVKDYNLVGHKEEIKTLLLERNLTADAKIQLLKIKLDYIINGEFNGKRTFLILSILSLFVLYFSGIGALSLFLSALFQLFKEGKISKAIYKMILKRCLANGTAIPAEYMVND